MSDSGEKGGAVRGQTSPTQTNLGQQAAGAYRAGLGGTMANAFRPAGQVAGTDLTPYMNQFDDAVVSRTMGELNRQRDLALQGVGDRAIAAGAFGGDRHGVAEAELGRGYADIQANTLADLFRGGYDRALGLAQGDIRNRMSQQQLNLAGASQLGQFSNLGFGQNEAIQNMLNRTGTQQQMLQQAIIDAARRQWGGFTGAPDVAQSRLTSGLTGYQLPYMQTGAQGYEPGIFDYLGFAAKTAGPFLL